MAQFIRQPQRQSFPGAPSNTMDLSYDQFFQPQPTGSQTMQHLFDQPQQQSQQRQQQTQQQQTQQQYYNFSLPSGESLDSGYAGDDINPFEQSNTYCQDLNNVDFGQNPVESANDFGGFNFISNDQQSNSSDINFLPITFSAPFQQQNFDLADQRVNISQSPPGLVMDDATSIKSEDASIDSVSPRQTTFQDSKPAQAQPPVRRPSTLKRAAADSSTEARPSSLEQPVAKEGGRGRERKRIPHTAVERRYRENLNLHLEKLRSAVPNLQAAHRRRSSEGNDPMKPSKCEVLIGAVEYIKRLEMENARLKKMTTERE